MGYVEGLNDARTVPSERCASAHQGRVGEKSDFFSILLNERSTEATAWIEE